MDTAKRLVLQLKQNNKSHVGYGLQKESEALVGHILQNIVKSQLPSLNPKKKNREESVKYREEGNQYFVMGDDIDAIDSYTMSLAYADSDELKAYAHANRSAALYRKQMYKECLIDIDAALNLGYPEDKKKKLKERGAKAIDEIKKCLKIARAEQTNGEEIMSLLSLSDKGPIKDEKFQGVECMKEKIQSKEASAGDEEHTEELLLNGNADVSVLQIPKKKQRYIVEQGPLKLMYGSNEEVPAVSAGVKVCFSERFGRHYVATKEFQPGDVITIEDPYAHVIYAERFYTHCHQCLARSYNLIPCPECPIAQYCSEKCRKTAWDFAHRTECPVWKLLPNLFNIDKDKLRMLTKIIRLLTVATANGTQLDALRDDMKKAESNPDCRTAGYTDEHKLDSSNVRSALSLATNMTTRPLIGISAFACISALASILLATQTNFFKRKYKMSQLKDISKFPDIRFCGSLMFRACVIMSSNCFSVQQEPGIVSGSGLYVGSSLYNHSCAPNTFRHFEGLTMISRALAPISPGEQIFTSYGPMYAYLTLSERKQKIMQDYFFDCDCVACTGNWPMYTDILRNHIGSIASNKGLVEKLKPFKERLLQNMYDIKAVKNVLCILYKEVSPPCEEIVHAEQYLKSYYLDP